MDIFKRKMVIGKILVFTLATALTACGGGGGGTTDGGTGGTGGTGGSGGSGGGSGGGSIGTATLSWTPPSTRLDGSALTNLAGYRVYYGTSSGNYSDTITINNVGLTEYVIDNLPSNTYYFVITAVDSSGAESPYSAEASKAL